MSTCVFLRKVCFTCLCLREVCFYLCLPKGVCFYLCLYKEDVCVFTCVTGISASQFGCLGVLAKRVKVVLEVRVIFPIVKNCTAETCAVSPF